MANGYGFGAERDWAYHDLARRLEAIRPTQTSEPRDDFSGTTWTWELQWPAGRVTTTARSWRGDDQGHDAGKNEIRISQMPAHGRRSIRGK